MRTNSAIIGLVLAALVIGGALYVTIGTQSNEDSDPVEVTIKVLEKQGLRPSPTAQSSYDYWSYVVRYEITVSEDTSLEACPVLILDGKIYAEPLDIVFRAGKTLPVSVFYILYGYDGHAPQSVEIIPATNWELNGLDVKLIQ